MPINLPPSFRLSLPTVTLALSLAISACASSGTKVSDDALARIQKGTSTAGDVLATLGPPQSDTRSSDGTRTLTYVYGSYQMRPESFIPAVGTLVGGADSKSQSVTVTIGPDGKVADITSTISNHAVNAGLLNQQ